MSVYSVYSYDGNSTSLCLTIDSPVILWDGSIVEAGDLIEGDKLKGYSLSGLTLDSDNNFFNWASTELGEELKEVEVKGIIYSFSSKYYDINNGGITATSEHPLLVKDSEDGKYRFKEIFRITTDDKLVKEEGGVLVEKDITSIELINRTSEIVSIDVEDVDTYLVNGYVTHNKGGNTFADLAAPGAPTSVAYASPFVSWTAPASVGTTGITAYDVQISTGNTFVTNTVDYSEWSADSIEVNTLLTAGTWYVRVRAIDQGLKGTWKDGKPVWQIKLKLEIELELKITGFNYGTGKNSKVISSVDAESEDGLLKTSPTGIKEKEMRKHHSD